MTDHEPSFCLIVATRNRPVELDTLLGSLAAQTWTDFVVLIADQSDATHQLAVHAVVERFSSLLRIEYLQTAGIGISKARNFALERARGVILALPDDDCWYTTDLLERVRLWFDRHPEHVLLTGRYAEPGRTNPRFPARAAELGPWNHVDRASSVTMFARRAAVKSLRFDERLGVGTSLPAGEEIDFLLRALAGGIRGRYEPDIVVFHPVLRPSVVEPASCMARETANAYVLLCNARRAGLGILYARLGLRLVKDLTQSPFSASARARLVNRMRGYRRAIVES